MDVGECWWMLMAIDGCWWMLMLMDVDGCWWVLLSVYGCWSMLIDVGDCWWMLMAVDGCWWLLMNVDGFLWMLEERLRKVSEALTQYQRNIFIFQPSLILKFRSNITRQSFVELTEFNLLSMWTFVIIWYFNPRQMPLRVYPSPHYFNSLFCADVILAFHALKSYFKVEN